MGYIEKSIDESSFNDVVREAATAALFEFEPAERDAHGAAAVEHALKRVKLSLTVGFVADPAEMATNCVLDFIDGKCGRPSRRLHGQLRQPQQPQRDPNKAPPKLKFINGNALRAMPKKEPWFLVAGVIQGRKVSLLMGEDGSGKSMLMLMLLLAVATGGEWLGIKVRQGPVIFLTAEEEAEDVWDRIAAIEETLGCTFDLKDFHLVVIDEDLDEFDEGAVLGAPGEDRKIQMTDLWRQLVAGVETIKLVAVGLDPLVEIFDGDEMVRVQARQFIAPMRKLARKRDLAIYLAGHPSKTSAVNKTGTAGSTGWSAATRGRQFLEILYDDDNNDTGKRKLHVKKVTGGKAGFTIDLSFNDVGVLVGAEGERVQDGKSAIEMALVKVSLAEHDFISFVMKRTEQGRPLFLNKKAGDYAPREFAASQGVSARDKRRTEGQHERTMEALLDQKRLLTEPFGPPSHRKMRLVLPSRKQKD